MSWYTISPVADATVRYASAQAAIDRSTHPSRLASVSGWVARGRVVASRLNYSIAIARDIARVDQPSTRLAHAPALISISISASIQARHSGAAS